MDGGTGWGVEMARLMHKPLYLYSMTHNRWFEYDRVEDRFETCLEPITSLMVRHAPSSVRETWKLIQTRGAVYRTCFRIVGGNRVPMKSKIYLPVIGS